MNFLVCMSTICQKIDDKKHQEQTKTTQKYHRMVKKSTANNQVGKECVLCAHTRTDPYIPVEQLRRMQVENSQNHFIPVACAPLQFESFS